MRRSMRAVKGSLGRSSNRLLKKSVSDIGRLSLRLRLRPYTIDFAQP